VVKDSPEGRALEQERGEILQHLEDWLEIPMLVLSFAWLLLFVLEVVQGLSPLLETLGIVIWIAFIFDFALKITLAPRKLAFLRVNWLTAIALLMPALRVFRVVRVVRALRAARAVRGLRVVRFVTSLNRGMKALGASLGRRGFGYVVALTGLVVVAGAAGMYALEHEVDDGFANYGEALWWTAMLLTSLGSAYWPQTSEGRVLCLLLAIYGFAVFGYITATLASFFIDRDADRDDAGIAGAREIRRLREEVAGLRDEIRVLRSDAGGRGPPAGGDRR
jgi:voltage-gated potassium channel